MNNRLATTIPAVALTLALSLTAASPADSQLAKVKSTGEALVLVPVVEARQFTLTVSGPCGFYHRETFKGGEIAFRLPRDAQSGRYRFSLDAVPVIDPEIMSILRQARASADNGRVRQLCRDGKLPTGPTAQSGAFAVVKREIIFDSTPESERSDRDGGKEAALLSPAPRADAELAAVLPPDPASDRLAAAGLTAPSEQTADCVWARMLPGAGVAER